MLIRSSLLALLLLGAADMPGGSGSLGGSLAPVVLSGKGAPQPFSPSGNVADALGCGHCEYGILITWEYWGCTGEPYSGSCEPHWLLTNDPHCHWSSAGSCVLASLDRGLGGVVLAATSSCSNDSGESVYFDAAIASARGSEQVLAEDWTLTKLSD
jgi:hypothetical protein